MRVWKWLQMVFAALLISGGIAVPVVNQVPFGLIGSSRRRVTLERIHRLK
jgi:hypothetical protein